MIRHQRASTPALQAREIQPIGSERKIPVDVRIVAATNRTLREAIRAGQFREDLYYRLNVIPLTLPPLRARPDDIPLLAQHFLARYAAKLGKPIARLEADALRILTAYPWPGNVRELESAIERAVTLAEGDRLDAAAFHHLREEPPEPAARRALGPLQQMEREYILEVLQSRRPAGTARRPPGSSASAP